MATSTRGASVRPTDRQPAIQRGESVRQSVMEAAIRLFSRQGIAGTSIDQIVGEAKVARMTLYHHFPSKDQLVIAALVYEGARWRRFFFAELSAQTGTPRKKLLSVFVIFERWFEQEDYAGCAFMNALLAQYSRDEKVLDVTGEHKRPFLDQLEALARAAGAKNPEELAYQLDLLLNGAIVNAVISRSSYPARSAKDVAKALLDSKLP